MHFFVDVQLNVVNRKQKYRRRQREFTKCYRLTVLHVLVLSLFYLSIFMLEYLYFSNILRLIT